MPLQLFLFSMIAFNGIFSFFQRIEQRFVLLPPLGVEPALLPAAVRCRLGLDRRRPRAGGVRRKDAPSKPVRSAIRTIRSPTRRARWPAAHSEQPCTSPLAGQPLAVQIGHPADLSLHAGVAAKANERAKLERLCRYISRPAISEKRLSLTEAGNIRYQLKTPYRDGTTHVMLRRASCPPPCGPAFGCSKSLPAILSNRWTLSPGWPRWCPSQE